MLRTVWRALCAFAAIFTLLVLVHWFAKAKAAEHYAAARDNTLTFRA